MLANTSYLGEFYQINNAFRRYLIYSGIMKRLPKNIAMVLLCLFTSVQVYPGELSEFHISSSGIDRHFYLHSPDSANKRYPVLLAFHGGGGTALNAEKQFGFSQLADRYGFVVVYPQGMNKQWNDGRAAPSKGEAYDDVQFVRDILRHLPGICPQADTSQVFSTGMSNGGFFSFYLAYTLNGVIDAIAPVCASIPKDLESPYTLPVPIPMLYIAGTADPLVKYKGGWVGFANEDNGRGYSMPAEWTLHRWLVMTGTPDKPVVSKITDMDKNDGSTATKYSYYRNDKPFVEFIKVENGGHGWPGGRQYLPKVLIGQLCNDFSASEMIIRFFILYTL
jgi:polyhydroxybutyrate depolymerase